MLPPIDSGTPRQVHTQVDQAPFDLRMCAATVIQVAVRIFFIFAVILMTAVVIPYAAYSIVLPLVGIGAATTASFFFPREF